ncbi:hypothetical protein B0H21DRAFT_718883 [Amylocystis lapponica]|nr:hypothetical protein B0H21DRAFT_718883 [Amylocystis lapponica]
MPRTTRAVRGKRGLLKHFPKMPLDVVIEIFAHLDPGDLLNLARTDKEFRAFLMSRRSAFVWKTARRNIKDFPECPPHLSEPAYANLAFSPYCHECLRGNVQTVLWYFNVRYCNKCKKQKTTSHRNISPQLFAYGAGLLCTMDVYPNRVHIPEVLEVEKVLNSANNKIGEDDYVKERRASVRRIMDHAGLCADWLRKKTIEQSEEKEITRCQRWNDILEKLREIGYSEELEDRETRYKLRKLPQAQLSKPLTDRAWLNIRADLIATLGPSLKDQRENERLNKAHAELIQNALTVLKEVILEHYGTLKPAQVDQMPLFEDLAHLSQIRYSLDIPLEDLQSLDISTLRDHWRASLPQLILTWQNNIKAELTAMIIQAMDIPEDVDVLALAVAIFDCTTCGRVLRYPALLVHGCMHPLSGSWEYDTYGRLVCSVGEPLLWKSSVVSFSSTLERTRPIMQACGLPIERTDVQRIENLGVRVCAIERDNPQVRMVMTWRAAVEGDWQDVVWELPDVDACARAARLDASSYTDMLRLFKEWPQWCCSLCFDPYWRKQTFERVCFHLLYYHDIISPAIDHIYQSADGWSALPQPVLVCSGQGGYPPVPSP